MQRISLFMTLTAITLIIPSSCCAWEWAIAYGGSDDDYARSVWETSDGGYVIAGSIKSFGAFGRDYWVLKLNGDGTVAWQKTYDGGVNDYVGSIQETSDGGYVVAGETDFFNTGRLDYWVLKLNGDGTVAWQKTYDGGSGDHAYSIQETSDGGYVVVGDSYAYSSAYWIMKLNGDGTVAWQKTYGGSSHDHAYSVQETSDGGYVVAGLTYSFGAGDGDFWVLKLNGDGTVAWQKTYGGSYFDFAWSVQETSDDGYVVAGYTYSFGAGDNDYWVLKLNGDGTVAWQKTYGGSNYDEALSIQETSDGGYVVAGHTQSFGAGGNDYWILRLNSDGEIPGCELGSNSNAIVTDTEATITNTTVSPLATNAVIADTDAIGQDTSALVTVICRESSPNAISIDTNYSTLYVDARQPEQPRYEELIVYASIEGAGPSMDVDNVTMTCTISNGGQTKSMKTNEHGVCLFIFNQYPYPDTQGEGTVELAVSGDVGGEELRSEHSVPVKVIRSGEVYAELEKQPRIFGTVFASQSGKEAILVEKGTVMDLRISVEGFDISLPYAYIVLDPVAFGYPSNMLAISNNSSVTLESEIRSGFCYGWSVNPDSKIGDQVGAGNSYSMPEADFEKYQQATTYFVWLYFCDDEQIHRILNRQNPGDVIVFPYDNWGLTEQVLDIDYVALKLASYDIDMIGDLSGISNLSSLIDLYDISQTPQSLIEIKAAGTLVKTLLVGGCSLTCGPYAPLCSIPCDLAFGTAVDLAFAGAMNRKSSELLRELGLDELKNLKNDPWANHHSTQLRKYQTQTKASLDFADAQTKVNVPVFNLGDSREISVYVQTVQYDGEVLDEQSKSETLLPGEFHTFDFNMDREWLESIYYNLRLVSETNCHKEILTEGELPMNGAAVYAVVIGNRITDNYIKENTHFSQGDTVHFNIRTKFRAFCRPQQKALSLSIYDPVGSKIKTQRQEILDSRGGEITECPPKVVHPSTYFSWDIPDNAISGIYTISVELSDNEEEDFIYDSVKKDIYDFYVGVLEFATSCPVDLLVADPNGRKISKTVSEVPNASYAEVDIDGDIGDRIIIPDPLIGKYSIQVIPEPGALPTETYTLDAIHSYGSVRLAENVQIKDLPAEPYAFVLGNEFSFTMEQGWNLISLPVQPLDTRINSVLFSIRGKCRSVYRYIPNQGWLWYSPSAPEMSNLWEMASGIGYWVLMEGSETLFIQGTLSESEIPLTEGWNLIGHYFQTSEAIQDCMSSITGSYNSVWEYDPDEGWRCYFPGAPIASNLECMKPWYGYWIDARTGCVWSIGTPSP